MRVEQTHYVEPAVTVRLSKTEVNIIRAALYHSNQVNVANAASAHVDKVDELTEDFIGLHASL